MSEQNAQSKNYSVRFEGGGEEQHNHSHSQSEPLARTACVYCSTMLSYPAASVYIHCPKCQNTMNVTKPNVNYMNCYGCGTLLSHPPSSLTIQCPKCLVIVELPVRPSVMMPSGSGREEVQNRESDPKTEGKKRKKKRDPNAPKRASNAYMIFCKKRRSELKKENPDLPFGKIGSLLGEMWRTMSPKDKKPYEDMAKSDRERYQKEVENYQAPSN